MLTRLRRLFAAPLYDEDQTRLAGMVAAILAASSITGAVAVPIIVLFSNPGSRLPIWGLGAASAAGIAVLYLLLRRGRVRLAALLLPAIQLIILTPSVYFLGGIHSPAMAGYLIVLMGAGLLSGRAGAVLYAVISGLAALGLWQAEAAGWLPADPDMPGIGTALFYVAWFGLGGALLALAARRMQEGMDTVRGLRAAEQARARDLDEHLTVERKRARQMELLADVARDLTGLYDLHELLEETVQRVQRDFGFEDVTLLLVEGDSLVVRTAAGVFAELIEPGVRIPLGRGIIGWVGESGQTYLTNDTSTDSRFVPLPGAVMGSEMAAPLRLGKSVIGVLNATSGRAGAFDEADVRTLESLADLLAAALRSGRLLSELRSRERLAEALRRVGEAVTASLDLSVVLHAICTESCAVFDADGATAWLVEGEEMCIAAAHGFAAESILGARFSVADPVLVAARAVRERRPVIVHHVMRQAAGPPNLRELTHAQAVLAAPIIHDGQPIGALVTIDARQPDRFTAQDGATAELLSAQLAVAIHNARLFAQAERRARQLSMLNTLAHEMTGMVEIGDLCQYVARSLVEKLGYYSAALFTVDEAASEVVLAAVAGARSEQAVVGEYRQAFGQGLIGLAAQSGERQVAKEAKEHLTFCRIEEMPARHEAALPLKAGDRLLGVLGVVSDRGDAFSTDDLVTLATVGDQAAVALEKARLFEGTLRRAEEFSGLYDIALATSGVLDPDALLQRLSEYVQRLVSPDTLGVVLFDAERGEVEIALAVEGGRPLDEAVGMRLPVDDSGLTGWVIRSRQPLLVGDLETDPLPAQPRTLTRAARAWLGVPLIVREAVVGALSVQSFRPHAFNERDRYLVETLAGQVAIALENARLYQSVQQQAAEIGSLYRASSALLNPSGEMQDVAQRIAEMMTQEFEFTHCDVRLADDAGTTLSLVAQAGTFQVTCPPLRLDGPGIVAEAARSGRPAYYPDVTTAPSYIAGHSLTLSELAVPLWVGDRLLGVLNMESPERDAFPERSRRIVSAFAERAALALENVRLMAAERRRVSQLGLLYDVSRQVAGTLEAEVICQRTAEALVNQFGYAQAAVMLPAGDGQLEVIAMVSTEDMGVPVGFRQGADSGVIGRAAVTRTAYYTNDIGADPYYFNPLGRSKGSALAAPLVREQKLLGVLYIETNQAGAFSPADVRALETLASHVATGLENAQLYSQVRGRLREMTGLQSMSQAVASSLELDDIFETVVLLLHDIFGYHYVTLALLDGETLRLASQVGYPSKIHTALHISQGISGRAVRTGKPQFVADVSADPDYVPGVPDVESEITVPLVKDETVQGVIDISCTPARPLTETDVNLLITFAGQVSVAIENARLFQAEREQRELAEALRAAGAALSTSLSYDTLLDLLLEHIGRLAPYDSGCLLAVRDGVAWVARLKGYEPLGEEAIRVALAIRMEIAAFPALKTMHDTRAPQIVSDTAADPDWQAFSGLTHIRSWAGAPIVARDRVIAFFSLEKHEAGYYQPAHIQRLAAFAGQAALALQNALLFEEAEHWAAELEALRQASLLLTSSLEPHQVLSAILNGAFRLLPDLGNAHIFLYSQDRLTFGAAQWREGGREAPWAEPRPNGLTYTVARTGEAVVVPDMRIHPLFAAAPQDWVGAIAGLPLKIGDRVVGVMNVAYPQPREFAQSEMRLMRLLGDQAAVAIENGRLYQAERQQRNLAEALRDAAQALSSTLDLASILDRLLEELAHILPHDSSSVMMIEDNYYVVVGGRNLPQADNIGHLRVPIAGPLAHQLNQKRRPVVLVDAQADPRFEHWGGTEYVRGWIGVPLISRDTVIGVLTLDSRTAGAYSERDAELAFVFAGQAAIAIENARLYEDLQARAGMLAALNETALDISIPHELPVVLETIVERAARLLRAPSGGLYLCDPQRREVRCLVSYNTREDYVGVVLKYGEGAAGKVAETGEPLIIDDYRAWPERADVFEAERPFVAIVSAPMIWQGQVTGVIHVEDHTGARRFVQTDLELLKQLASQAAVAVEAARLLAETQRRAEEQRLLFDATRDFTAGLNETGVLRAVARHMVTALKVYNCAVSRWDRANDTLVTLLDYDETAEPDPLPPGTAFSLAEFPATRQVLETRQPLIVRADDPTAEKGERDLLRKYEHGVELILPLAAGERVFGLIELFRPVGAATFTDGEVELAQSLAAQAATALENAALHAAVSERARELDALVTANSALLSTLELDPLLRNILQAAIDAIPPAEKGAILLVDPVNGGLVMRAVVGYHDPRTLAVRLMGQASYSVRALRERTPQLVYDAWADPAVRYTGDIAEMREIRSAVAVPLMVQNEANGVLSLDSTRVAAFSESDLRLLAAFASTAAAAIDNAQLHAEVQRLAITDSLTGLTNRRAFDRALETEVSRAIRYGYSLTLIILDIDNFKAYNDTYGHPAGDRRLVAIADLLRANVRDPDLAARYGGEEFALILPHTDKAGALALAERVRGAAEGAAGRRPGAGTPLAGFTVSLGVATYPDDAGTAEELLQAADRAELEAKHSGKNRVRAAPDLEEDR